MNIENLQKHFTVERLVHASMIVFALYSATNIQATFQDAGKEPFLSWILGIAMGICLVSSAISLSKISPTDEKTIFWILFSIVICLALLSGVLQLDAYTTKEQVTLKAITLAFGLPLICEMGLAIGMSLYDEAHKRQVIRNMDANTDQQIAFAVSEVLSDVDLDEARKIAKKETEKIVRQKIKNSVARLMVSTPAIDTQSNGGPIHPKRTESPKQDVPAAPSDTSIDKANEARQDKVVLRREAIQDIVQRGPIGVSDIIEALSDDLKASRAVIASDLKQLATDGHVYNESRKWHPVLGTQPQLGGILTEPTGPVYVNGAH